MNQSVKRNYLYSIFYQILAIIIPLITAPYISRILGAEGIGTVSYSRSIAQYFCIFALLGVSNYGNRTIAANRENKEKLSDTFWSIYYFQIFTSLIVISAYIAYLVLFCKSNLLIALIQSLYVIGALFDVSWLFFGLENFKITVTRNVIVKLTTFILTFVVVKNSADIWQYALLSAGGNILAQLLLWKDVFKFVTFRKPDLSAIKTHIRPILILFIPVITISIYKIMDKIMIGAMSDMVQSGFYENSEKIITIPMSLITAFGTVMLPRMSNMYANNNDSGAKKLIRISMHFSMALAFAMCFGLCAISKTFVPIYFGSGFEGCEKIISVLAFTIIFVSWANVIRTQYLIPKKRDKEYIISVVFGAVVNLVANILLIPTYGAYGAAIGTLLAEISVTLVQTLLNIRELEYFSYVKDTVPFIISGILMFYVVGLTKGLFENNIVSLLVQIAVGVVLYCLCNFVFLRFFQKEKYKFYTNIFLKGKKHE